MANSYNKNFVRQVMTLEMDRLILKKTNEKIAEKAEEAKEAEENESATKKEELELIKAQLIDAERAMEQSKQRYENPPHYQPHGLIYNFFHKSDMDTLADWLISLFTIVFWTALGLVAGYWVFGIIKIANVEMSVRIFLGMVCSFIGLHIGGKIVEESCRDCLLAIWFMELYWAAEGVFIGYWLIGQIFFETGMGVRIILGVVFAGIGFFIGWLHRILVELDDWFDNPFNFTTKKQDIEYAKRLPSIYKAEYEASVEHCEQLKEQYKQLKEQYATFKKKSELSLYSPHRGSVKLQRQFKRNQENIECISEMLEQYYDLDIIPPDYRTIDCVITLDHIFQNDLADTMRDAVLLYKNWLFQGMIIQGMEKIYSMVGNLSAQMQYMQTTLDNIESQTASFYDDLNDLFEKQGQTQEKLLEESRCTRYAAESIKRSNEKYEWYVEQHRQGLL